MSKKIDLKDNSLSLANEDQKEKKPEHYFLTKSEFHTTTAKDLEKLLDEDVPVYIIGSTRPIRVSFARLS